MPEEKFADVDIVMAGLCRKLGVRLLHVIRNYGLLAEIPRAVRCRCELARNFSSANVIIGNLFRVAVTRALYIFIGNISRQFLEFSLFITVIELALGTNSQQTTQKLCCVRALMSHKMAPVLISYSYGAIKHKAHSNVMLFCRQHGVIYFRAIHNFLLFTLC